MPSIYPVNLIECCFRTVKGLGDDNLVDGSIHRCDCGRYLRFASNMWSLHRREDAEPVLNIKLRRHD